MRKLTCIIVAITFLVFLHGKSVNIGKAISLTKNEIKYQSVKMVKGETFADVYCIRDGEKWSD